MSYGTPRNLWPAGWHPPRGRPLLDVYKRQLYRYVKERLPEKKRAYLFFDEIQRIDQWQDAVNSFRVDFDCDIYVTGSNCLLYTSPLPMAISWSKKAGQERKIESCMISKSIRTKPSQSSECLT